MKVPQCPCTISELRTDLVEAGLGCLQKGKAYDLGWPLLNG